MTAALVPYRYDCTRGHQISANHPLTRCPACVRGSQCDGTLVPRDKATRDRTEGEK